jgi:hypothetical protein
MKPIACMLLITTLVISCSDDSGNEKNTFAYFEENLKADMKYSDLTMIFGLPDEDIGSGIHIYIYHLDDGTQIVIGYTDYIHNARHLDKDHNLLHSLI